MLKKFLTLMTALTAAVFFTQSVSATESHPTEKVELVKSAKQKQAKMNKKADINKKNQKQANKKNMKKENKKKK
jgi:hypothetical protein